MYSIVWKLNNNIYLVDFQKLTCKVSGNVFYEVEGEHDLKGMLNALEGTARNLGVDVPKEVKDFLYR